MLSTYRKQRTVLLKSIIQMKIGILTFHCAHNYGAVLHCYALQETLKAMGHDVKVIDYRPEFLLTPYKVWDIHRDKSYNSFVRRLVLECLKLSKRIARHKAFDSFIQTKLCLTKEKTILPSFDAYIMGSDQIWNPQITNGFHKPYFGYFDFPKENRKYIAYAASMETSSLSQKAKDFYKKALDNFDAISVREKALAELLQHATSKKIETVLDPTLLINATMWDSIAKPPLVHYKYILVYQVRYNKNTLRIAQSIANQIGAKVIEITSLIYQQYKKNVYQCCSPEEFLGWIKYASCVVTTSFHGTAFSVIFNRPFYCLKLEKVDTRAASLLQELGLENRMVEKTSSPDFQLIDYQQATMKLTNLQKKSYQYLVSALNL